MLRFLSFLWIKKGLQVQYHLQTEDVVAVTFIGKMCSVLLTIYSLFVVAIATGVVVNFYTQMVELQRKETLAMFMDQLERLPELSREELENISRKVRQFR